MNRSDRDARARFGIQVTLIAAAWWAYTLLRPHFSNDLAYWVGGLGLAAVNVAWVFALRARFGAGAIRRNGRLILLYAAAVFIACEVLGNSNSFGPAAAPALFLVMQIPVALVDSRHGI